MSNGSLNPNVEDFVPILADEKKDSSEAYVARRMVLEIQKIDTSIEVSLRGIARI